MDNDLIYRLRKRYVCECTIVGRRCDVCNDRHKAATYIEELEEQVASLKDRNTAIDKEADVLRIIVEHYKFLYEMISKKNDD